MRAFFRDLPSIVREVIAPATIAEGLAVLGIVATIFVYAALGAGA